MAPPTVRSSLHPTWLAPLWALSLCPFLLWCMHLQDPVLAVALQRASAAFALRALLYLAGAAVVLALLWPPFPAAIRYGFAGLRSLLQRDARPYQRALAALQGFESAQRQLDAGRAALAIGDAKAALPHLVRAVELDPALWSAHHLLGTALLELGRNGQAIEALSRAVAGEPDLGFGDALLRLGRARMLAGDPAAAAADLERHARLHGGSRKSHYWLGRCRLAIGDRDGARAAFRIAAAAPPPRRTLPPEEALFRARARTALWRSGVRA